MAWQDNLRTPTSEEAREMQKKSAQKRSENAKERKLIKDRILERMGESDWNEMIDNFIARSKESDDAFRTLRDTIGEKPKDIIDISSNDIRITIDD